MPDIPVKRPDPEQLLRQVEAEEDFSRRGRLKVFLGYSSGVGKSFRMLDEARRRQERGQDVVIGAVQDKRPGDVDSLLAGLEAIPMRTIKGQSAMDVPAILRRHPEVVVVDGLAFKNPPGSGNAERWQDCEEILRAGISVIGSVNLQYIAEMREQVEALTGKAVTDTIPKSFLSGADEIVIVDAPPEQPSLQESLGPQTQERLSVLRELTLVLAADVVDKQLEDYLERHGIENLWGTQERILVCVTPRANVEPMIASGRRNADRFHGELFACYVEQDELSAENRGRLEANLSVAREARAQIEILHGEDPIHAIMGFARERGITQIFVGHSFREGFWTRIFGGPVDKFVRAADGIDVRVFPH